MLPAFRYGLGGKIGTGRQWVSWIHIADLIAMYLSEIDEPRNVLNATAPNPVTNAAFTHALAAALHRPAFATVPPFALRAMFGDGADVIASGQRVLPKRAEMLEFSFAYPTLPEALDALIKPDSEQA
jgi:uncharacterized protein